MMDASIKHQRTSVCKAVKGTLRLSIFDSSSRFCRLSDAISPSTAFFARQSGPLFSCKVRNSPPARLGFWINNSMSLITGCKCIAIGGRSGLGLELVRLDCCAAVLGARRLRSDSRLLHAATLMNGMLRLVLGGARVHRLCERPGDTEVVGRVLASFGQDDGPPLMSRH